MKTILETIKSIFDAICRFLKDLKEVFNVEP